MTEADELFSTLLSKPPTAPTACAGWTAHDLVAHLAAGAQEMAVLTEEAVAGKPPRETRPLHDREAPFVALDDGALRERLVVEALRLNAAIEALGAVAGGGTVYFSGRNLGPSDLVMHGRSEAAIHRWDLAGDDTISAELLRQPELTIHALKVLNEMPPSEIESIDRRGCAAGPRTTGVTFASPGQPDVAVVSDVTGTRLELVEPTHAPTASADAAVRLLALWGRRSALGTITWSDDQVAAGRLRFLLWGDDIVQVPPDQAIGRFGCLAREAQ